MHTLPAEVQSKIIAAHEKLWKLVVVGTLPLQYSEAMLRLTICTPDELEAHRKKSGFLILGDEDFEDFNKRFNPLDLHLVKPFIDDRLWEMAQGRLSIVPRLLYLFSTANKGTIVSWPEDSLVAKHLRTAFSEKELAGFAYSTPGTFREITTTWDARILAEVKKALLGCEPRSPSDPTID